jgi:low affinity Fe/Cu permease
MSKVDWTKFDECSDEALELWEQAEELLVKFFNLERKDTNNQFTIEHLREMLSEEMIDSIEFDTIYKVTEEDLKKASPICQTSLGT